MINTNLTKILTLHATSQPNAVAIYTDKGSITYALLENYVWRVATYFYNKNIREGDIVIHSIDDDFLIIIAMLATARIGATLVAVSMNTPTLQLQNIAKILKPSCIITDTKHNFDVPLDIILLTRELLRNIDININYDAYANTPKYPWEIVVGSGTTGKQKLLPVTHIQIQARIELVKDALNITKFDKIASLIGLNYTTTKLRFLTAIATAASYIILDKTLNNLIPMCTKFNATVLTGTVFHIENILKKLPLNSQNIFGFLRILSIVSSTVTDNLRERIKARLTVNLSIGYGMNEVGFIVVTTPENVFTTSQTVGYPVKNVILEIVDDFGMTKPMNEIGHVRVKCPGMIEGYISDEKATTHAFKDGWFYPGDLGKFTVDGQLIFCGRSDHMMILNGINIYPAEIETVITSHLSVRDAAAMPIKHPIHQDIPICAVTLCEGHVVDTKELMEYCIQRIGFRALKEIIILDKIPRNEQGKLIRIELEKQINAILGVQPRKVIMQKEDLLNLRQTTQQYRVNLTLPSNVDLNLLGIWFKEVFELETTSSEKNEIVRLSQKALILTKNMLQHSQIPVYYDGSIVNIKENEKNKFIIDLAVSYIDFIPNQHYSSILNFTFKSLFWMMQNQCTPQNKQIFYKACLDEIITPIKSSMPAGKSTIHVLKIAYFKNIPFIHLGAGVYQLGWGAKSRKMDRSTVDTDSAMGSKLSQNKVITANLLKMAGLPSPLHGVTNNKEIALKIAHEIGYPVVVKPSDLDRGEGVRININNDAQLLEAYEKAMQLSKQKQVIVERQVVGICHRLFIAEGKLLYTVIRQPISVQGDGEKTVSQLIAEANRLEDNKAPWNKKKPFPLDAHALEAIHKSGFNISAIPPKGVWVPLRDIESSQWGGRSEDATQITHPDNLAIALEASKLFELRVVGVDIITTDISKPWHETGAIINEVNFAPLFGGGEISKSYMPNFFDTFIEKDGRIPLEIFIGEDEATMRKAKARQKKLLKEGLKCYVTTHDITFDAHGNELKMPSKGISNRTKALLLNANVEALILVLQNDEFLGSIIPFDKISKLHASSININSQMQLLKNKCLELC